MVAAAKGLTVDQVEPGRRGRGEVQLDARVLGQPGPHHRVLVGGVAVADHVQAMASDRPAICVRTARNSWWRWRGAHWLVMGPVAIFSAANKAVVPCRRSSWVRC
jgi:hypothetical protein